jgi:hypothetical protein
VNGTIKLGVTLASALAIAACSNAGGTSSVPGATGSSAATHVGQTVWSVSHRVPQWYAQNLAHAACPQVFGKLTCLALVGNHIDPAVNGLGANDIETRYNLPYQTDGSGQVVAIVDSYDDPDAASDLATYRTEYGLGTANFNKYNQDGQTSNYPQACTVSSGWCVEEALDIEMVSAACPKCTIDLIEVDNPDDLPIGDQTAVTLGAHIVSNSWICYGSDYGCGVSTSYFDSPNTLYLAASGDAGYNENGAPEAFSTVVSVGGTTLSKSGTGYTETVWNDAGGGCSNNGSGTGVTKPSWQKDPDCSYRTDADVSAVACICVAEYDSENGGWFEVGGTSVATPINAGIFALAGNASTQNAGEKFWKLKKHKRKHDLHYIDSGSDGSCGGEYLCEAGTKQFGTYSGPAGWGTPNGIKAY